MSKRKWHHPEVSEEDRGTVVWRSANELEKTPTFQAHLQREFPDGADVLSDDEREMTRRDFSKLMGASSALMGLTLASCRRPEAYIAPYAKSPEWVIPGKPLFYASAMPAAGGATPLVVTTYEGRPTKLEANKDAADSSGLSGFVQGSILDLYSPDRSREVLKDGKKSSLADLNTALAEIAGNAGSKIAFVFGEDESPSRNSLAGKLKAKFSGAKFYSYEQLAAHGAGKTVAQYQHADRILSLGSDFLGNDNAQGPVRAFYAKRQGGGADYKHEIDAKKMNRTYVVEAAFTQTGGIADHRLRVAPSRIALVAKEVAKALGVDASKIQGELSGAEKKAICGSDANFSQWVKECANDLKSHNGKALVLAGTQQPAAVRDLAIEMNKAIGAIGAEKPLRALKSSNAGFGSLKQLADDLNSGAVDTLVLATPANPLYDAPASFKFKDALKKAKTSISLGLWNSETAEATNWHVPAAHYLESWGDTLTANGTYAVVQPLILPLFGGVSELELLQAFLTGEAITPGETADGGPSTAMAAVRWF